MTETVNRKFKHGARQNNQHTDTVDSDLPGKTIRRDLTDSHNHNHCHKHQQKNMREEQCLPQIIHSRKL